MEYNKTILTIGKVRSYDNITGEIIAKEGSFIFTSNNVDPEDSLNIDDIVFFRGEEVQGTKKAFYIKKLNPDKDLNNQIYQKTKNKRFLKEND